MQKHLPIFFIAGGDDPVGSYGKGVLKTEAEFRKAGMVNVTCKLYPGGRHEILNEIQPTGGLQDVAMAGQGFAEKKSNEYRLLDI